MRYGWRRKSLSRGSGTDRQRLAEPKQFRFAPEGKFIILTSVCLFVSAALAALFIEFSWKWVIPASAGIWLGAVLQFFRDPVRFVPTDVGVLIAPADGRVIIAGDATDDSPFSPKGKQVSIFMSPLNVHVNRAPYSGEIRSVKHTKGKFLSAFKPEASKMNENNLVHLETKNGRVAFKQIAGFLARRIVFHPNEDERVTTGERIGMIKFGSRMDLFVENDVKLNVKVGDVVKAGETIVGEFID